MTKPLASRLALVTGASRGIGYATALALAKAGAHIVAVARTQGGLEELDDAIRAVGGSATLVPLNMTDSEGVARLGAALHERHGKLDILVGNAGIAGPSSPLGHIELKPWSDVIAWSRSSPAPGTPCRTPRAEVYAIRAVRKSCGVRSGSGSPAPSSQWKPPSGRIEPRAKRRTSCRPECSQVRWPSESSQDVTGPPR